MRQKLAIVGTILLIIGVLFAINAATYVSKDETKDYELSPNRSTYHAGPTGTRALYDFLNESGSKVMRWRESPDKLLGKGNEAVRTFVIIGDTPVKIDVELFGDHLRDRDVDALAHVHLAEISGHAAVGNDGDPRVELVRPERRFAA